MIKRSIQEEDVTIININIPNIGAFTYTKQMLMHVNTGITSNTMIVGDQLDGKSATQKFGKEMITLNATLNQLNLIDILRTFHSQNARYTFFSSTLCF